MGSPGDTSEAIKPPNPKDIATPASISPAPAADLPPASAATPQEVTPMVAYSEWTASMQAYFASGAMPPAAYFQPPWGGQMMTPYGTPLPYSPLYYPHPSFSAGTPPPNAELERRATDWGSAKKAKKATSGKSGNGGKVTSDSGYDDASQSGESGSEGSSSTGGESNWGESNDLQGLTVRRKRTSSDAFREGEGAQAGAQYGTIAEASNSGRVAKLPVSAPGRAALLGTATNLNIGLDVWNASHAGTGPMKMGPNAMGVAPVLPDHRCIQVDERELKREKRKQSNRESARRSRMRKQQECEDLAKKVAEISDENSALRIEVGKLKKDFRDLQAENASLMVHLKSKKPDLLTEEEQASLHHHSAISQAEGVNGSNTSTSLSAG